MSVKEHNEEDIIGDELQNSRQLSIDCDSVKISLRNTYWTKDYTTGIKLFIKHMKRENDLLIKDIKFYNDFVNKFWKPTLNNLQKMEATNSMNSRLLEVMSKQFNIISTEQVERDCKIPLQELRDLNESFLREAENDLSSRYSAYIKDLVAAKEALIGCEKRVQSIYKLKKAKTPVENSSSVFDNGRDSAPLTRLNFVCEFPYTLDERLKFEDCDQFMSFLQTLKGKVILEKSVFSVPGLPNQSFQGRSLIKELKKLEPRLNLSLFNIDRIGNEFIQLGIIQEYSLSFYSSKVSQFDQEKYYYWNSEVLATQESNGNAGNRKKKSYGELTHSDNEHEEKSNVSSIKTSISDWIRKVSQHDNDDCDAVGSTDMNKNEWKSLKQQLESSQDIFFSKCCQLEYSKVQLEKSIYDYCKNYSKMEDGIKRALESSNKMFQQKCEKFTDSPVCSLQEAPLPQETANADVRGFFLRDNGIPFRRWNILEASDPVDACKEISIKSEKFFCGSEINNELAALDTLGAIKIILRQIEKEPNASKVIQSWHRDIDFVRVSNLKRDLLGEFKGSKTTENTNSIITAHFFENSHSYVTNDLVGLIKLWLLELPDSLIPSNHYDDLVKAEKSLTSLCEQFPTSSLRFLQELANHFQLINSKYSLPPQTIQDLFRDNSDIDIPLAHHFVRRTGLQNPIDIKILSPTLSTFFINERTVETLQTLIANRITTATTATLTEPPTIIIKDTTAPIHSTPKPPPNDKDGHFIPRPFKTSSTPTTPERPKRKSGLFLPINVNDVPST
ncbi:CDA_G0024990.mRNA.1.CDS.1 [Saccharomyces cerevisiae]|nr:CDA_G0024990.mRNA.1.CDS.1 [Saccharomyces cerevisiae]CAI7340014.1 CDA_G0024990.mRNA.1.CDS.1 [Saccharomyces cerevisiae]